MHIKLLYIAFTITMPLFSADELARQVEAKQRSAAHQAPDHFTWPISKDEAPESVDHKNGNKLSKEKLLLWSGIADVRDAWLTQGFQDIENERAKKAERDPKMVNQNLGESLPQPIQSLIEQFCMGDPAQIRETVKYIHAHKMKFIPCFIHQVPTGFTRRTIFDQIAMAPTHTTAILRLTNQDTIVAGDIDDEALPTMTADSILWFKDKTGQSVIKFHPNQVQRLYKLTKPQREQCVALFNQRDKAINTKWGFERSPYGGPHIMDWRSQAIAVFKAFEQAARIELTQQQRIIHESINATDPIMAETLRKNYQF